MGFASNTDMLHEEFLEPGVACLDTGASGNYWAQREAHLLTNLRPTDAPLTVRLPKRGATATSTHRGCFRVGGEYGSDVEVHVFPSFRGSLLSVAALADVGFEARFSRDEVVFWRNGRQVFRGYRAPGGYTWCYRLSPTTGASAPQPEPAPQCALLAPISSMRDHIAFSHAAMGSPAISTLTEAVKRGFVVIPGLTLEALKKWEPHSVATAKGHLDRVRQGQRSTREYTDDFPKACGARRQKGKRMDVFTHIYADLAGRFPQRSYAGNEYLMVAYIEDVNFIKLFPLKDRSAPSLVQAHFDLWDWCDDHGVEPNLIHLDNEAPRELFSALRGRGAQIQLCPPGNHRANVAERCIRTAKNHFVAVLSAADPSFPLAAWDLLLGQIELNLNLLRASPLNPTISAWHGAHGPHDFAAHPFAPQGMKVLAFEDPGNRPSWAPHGVEAFYVGPALSHYRSFEVFVPSTGKVRVTDTLAWFPHSVIMPAPSPVTDLQGAMKDLEKALDSCAQCPQLAGHSRLLDEGVHSTVQGLHSLRDAFGTLQEDEAPAHTDGRASTGKHQHGGEDPHHTQVGGGAPGPPPVRGEGARSGGGGDPDVGRRSHDRSLGGGGSGRWNAKEPATSQGERAQGKTVRGNGPGHPSRMKGPPPDRTDRAQDGFSGGADPGRQGRAKGQHATPVADVSGHQRGKPEKGPTPAAPAGPAPHGPASGGGQGRTGPARGRPSHSCPGCDTYVANGVQCTRCQAWWHYPCDSALTPQVRLRLARSVYFCSRCRSQDATCGVIGDREGQSRTFATATTKRSRAETRDRVQAAKPPARPRGKRRERKKGRRRTRRPSRREAAETVEADTSSHETRQEALTAMAATEVPADRPAEPSSYRAALAGGDREAWLHAMDQEWERLVETWACLTFVASTDKPHGVQACYCNPVVKVKEKPEGMVRRVRVTAGGDKITYMGDVTAETASMETIKLLWNKLCSEQAEWMCIDIVDFYLGTPLEEPQWMWVPINMCPDATRSKFGLDRLAVGGKVLARIDKGIYGLPQAGRLAREKLVGHLGTHGYQEMGHTPGLFRHGQRKITFTLVVDDFGVVYHERADAGHLIQTLEGGYQVKVDWEGRKYVGISTSYDRRRHTLTLSMPGYVAKAMRKLGIASGPRDVHSATVYTPPEYGRKGPQEAPQQDNTPEVGPEQATWLQRVVGIFLFYARAVDATMAFGVGKLSTELARPTQRSQEQAHRVLQYAATNPDAEVTIHPSAMVLRGESDASWLTEKGSRSRVGGVWFLGAQSDETPFNAPVEVVSAVTKIVASSAAEAEYLALYHNTQKAVKLKASLEDLGYPQPATPVKTDSICAQGLADGSQRAKRTKAVLMRYDWLKEQVADGMVRVFWRRGTENRADYFTKSLPVHQIKAWRPQWIGAEQQGQSAWMDCHRRPTRAAPPQFTRKARELDACVFPIAGEADRLAERV